MPSLVLFFSRLTSHGSPWFPCATPQESLCVCVCRVRVHVLRVNVCLCVGCIQTSCGLGWISSPARLLLDIHPGFSSQSKSGRPRLSQHTTGPSMSSHSGSSSAGLSAGQFSVFPTRQQECCEGEESLCSSGWYPDSACWSPACVWLSGPWHCDETWPRGIISIPSCWHGATRCIKGRVPLEKVPLVLL